MNREASDASGTQLDAKKMLDTRSEQVAELTRELGALCRKIEQTTLVALTSINEQLEGDDDEGELGGEEELNAQDQAEQEEEEEEEEVCE